MRTPAVVGMLLAIVPAIAQPAMQKRFDIDCVWTQVDATEMFADPKPGDPVRIKKASLGSYLMVVGKNGAVRAHREE